jgi:hypothetical protein
MEKNKVNFIKLSVIHDKTVGYEHEKKIFRLSEKTANLVEDTALNLLKDSQYSNLLNQNMHNKTIEAGRTLNQYIIEKSVDSGIPFRDSIFVLRAMDFSTISSAEKSR